MMTTFTLNRNFEDFNMSLATLNDRAYEDFKQSRNRSIDDFYTVDATPSHVDETIHKVMNFFRGI